VQVIKQIRSYTILTMDQAGEPHGDVFERRRMLQGLIQTGLFL